MLPLVRKKRIYLDFAAATPVRRQVVDAMSIYWNRQFGNPSAIHVEGVSAHAAVEDSREKIARILHTRTQEVIFTGSGTESNNLAIIGTIEQRKKEGILYSDMEVVSTDIEHPSVLQTLVYLESLGVVVQKVPVTEEGLIDEKVFHTLLSPKTVLVTFAYANSEIGVVQHVSKLSRYVRAYEAEHTSRIYVHIDAAQAPLWLPCAVDVLSADILSLDAGKCYGPKGVGVLAMRHGVTLASHMFGGGQERGLRPSTENVPLIVGGTLAIVLAQENFQKRAMRVAQLRDDCIQLLLQIDGVTLNGSYTQRLANNINISIKDIDSEFAVIVLDEHGIACSTKSACSGADGQGSSVVMALEGDEKKAHGSIRFSLGEETTARELQRTAAVLRQHIEKTRKIQKSLTA